MKTDVVLISIRPEYAKKILIGEKRLEFRRRWTSKQVSCLVIYVTSPVQRIVAATHVEKVHWGSKNHLWELAKKKGGGISRRKLFAYLEGRSEGAAIELATVSNFSKGALKPSQVFGENFRPPQSFRYLSLDEVEKLNFYFGVE